MAKLSPAQARLRSRAAMLGCLLLGGGSVAAILLPAPPLQELALPQPNTASPTTGEPPSWQPAPPIDVTSTIESLALWDIKPETPPPATPDPSTRPAPRRELPELVGVITERASEGEPRRYAVVIDGDMRQRVLGVGDSYGTFRVAAVNPSSIALERSGVKTTIPQRAKNENMIGVLASVAPSTPMNGDPAADPRATQGISLEELRALRMGGDDLGARPVARPLMTGAGSARTSVPPGNRAVPRMNAASETAGGSDDQDANQGEIN